MTSQGAGAATGGAGRPPLTTLPVGDHGLLIELPTSRDVEALHAELLRRAAAGALPAVREMVPAARTVFLDGLADPSALAAELAGWRIPPPTTDDRPAVELPVHYDGPDLAEVAALWGMSADEVVRLHSGTTFRVAFCGFAPGFGYLTGLPAHLHVPRRENPRTRVPVGSVGLAGAYTGIYPRSSPGGWRLIGRTDAVLWDPRREPAALLAPGTPVRFVPVDATVPAPRTAPSRPDRAPEEPAR
ncbi:5-oxoprolinase subunit PxpB [Streptomyces yunnanensis]|uniref:5-oxoprolinase subunit PxpB n=1 Tax=Streptomyces yunnanensis TaxID=156453 RepID=A0ABY8AFU5_9ACTN|nr:5-oxoprolinase subunit PxpB [Streptomyces yunnanensis]WEB43884.1 5-oxoprolinase subunit PxpB [Streptomyces yunnanensis]